MKGMQGEIIKINSQGVITIPAKYRKNTDFKEGSLVEIIMNDDGSLILIPVTVVPKDQVGFHTREWKDAEKKASEDLKTGKVKIYKTKKEFLKELSAED